MLWLPNNTTQGIGVFTKRSLYMIQQSRKYLQWKEVQTGIDEYHSLFHTNSLEVAKPMFSAENNMWAVKLT